LYRREPRYSPTPWRGREVRPCYVDHIGGTAVALGICMREPALPTSPLESAPPDVAGAEEVPTPLQPRSFFRGRWTGTGEVVPHLLLRWLIRREGLRWQGETEWLSDAIWLVRERMEFASGAVSERTMFSRLVAPDRIHVTADDMPLGADITLSAAGYRFSPYLIWTEHNGRRIRLRCVDTNEIQSDGTIVDTIRMSWYGLPVATLRMRVTVERDTN
jgi:hypothetical protein